MIRNSLQGSGTGKVNLVKNGAGDLLLGGSCTYTGATTVNGGTLQVTGSLQSTSGVSVASGATLYFNTAAAIPARRRSPGRGRCRFIKGRMVSARGRGTTPR